MIRIPLLLTIFSLAGCAAPSSLYDTHPVQDLQWPGPTTGPKIVWVKSIAVYQDAGITKGFWKRALEFFIGEDNRRIIRPHGVLSDDAERLYIADPGSGVVHCMNIREGRYSVIGGDVGSPLISPIGLAEDEQGRVYITDSKADSVFRYDPADESLKPFLSGILSRPTGITYNRVNSLIYIVDTTGQRVVAFDTEGHERLRFGSSGEGAGGFNHPTDIAVDRKGQLYVTDPLNYRIRIFTPDGQPLAQIGAAGDTVGSLSRPKGIGVDSGGHIYICDALLDTVQIFDTAGRFLLSFGRNGFGNGEFWMPSGLCIDRRDYIYVADTYNQRIQVFRYVAGTEAPPAPH